MKKSMSAVGAVILPSITVLITVMISTALSGVTAWIIGLVWGDIILSLFSTLGIRNFSMFEIGIFLGFITGFLPHGESKQC